MCETDIPLPPIRLMLLDDHEFILCGMHQTLSACPEIRVLGRFTRSRDLMPALKLTPIDIVVMDFSLGPQDTDGLNLIRTLRIKFPAIKLLVVSATHTPTTVGLAMRCGASGFIGKSSTPEHLVDALRAIATDGTYLEPKMAEQLRGRNLSTRNQTSPRPGKAIEALIRINNLTLREREVLRCCLTGMSVTQVAEKFSRSVKTISTQKQSAYRKLGLRSDNELFRIRSQLEDR